MNENLKTILAMAITAAGTLYATTTGYFNTSRELDIKMVDVSLAILRGEKGDGKEKQSIHARKFALRALSKYSGIKLEIADLNSWAESGVNLQFSPVGIDAEQSWIGTWSGTKPDLTSWSGSTNYSVPVVRDIFQVKIASPEKKCRDNLGLFIGNKFRSCYLGELKLNEKRP